MTITYRKNIDNHVEHPLLSLLDITEQCISFHDHYPDNRVFIENSYRHYVDTHFEDDGNQK